MVPERVTVSHCGTGYKGGPPPVNDDKSRKTRTKTKQKSPGADKEKREVLEEVEQLGEGYAE